MKLIVAISILTLIRAEDNQSVYIINGVPHYKEILFENLDPKFNYGDGNLAVDYKTNYLYVDLYNTSDVSVFHINTKEYERITGLSNPHCVTVDQVNHEVFVGTSTGIYKYNFTTGAVEFVGARGEDVWMIYHQNGVLYYSTFLISDEIKKLVNGISGRYLYLRYDVSNFVIDSEENFFYITYENRLNRYNVATGNIFYYRKLPAVKSLTVDTFGQVYFSVYNGIYKIKGDRVQRVVNITNPRYIAFDRDNNLIYYNDDEYKLYRLKPINITNKSPDSHRSHVQEHKVPDNTDIITELQILNKKINNLSQVVNVLLNVTLEKQLAHSDSLRTIHLDSIVLKNINISIGLNESGVAQIPST